MTPPPPEHGYRMPAEWEPHQSTWISWPHNEETWPEELQHVEATMAKVVKVLSQSEIVRINVSTEKQRIGAEKVLNEAGCMGEIRFHSIPTNDAWVRDYGPIFVVGKQSDLAATLWGFNSWGGKYPPYDLDDAAAETMASLLAVPTFDGGMILEGGSIDVNGSGMLLTTKSCLLNPNRNPHLSQSEIEDRLCRFLGVREVLWLEEGIAGDDTDGHIDDVARFVAEYTVVASVTEDTGSGDYDVLRNGVERLREATTPDGASLEVLELPMPAPLSIKGDRMPASYANFYVGNRTVLVPAFADPNDEKALAVLRQCFPTRAVVGIDCRDLIWGLGAFHCLTQQVPHGT